MNHSSYAKSGTQRKEMHFSPNLRETLYNAIANRKLASIEYDSYEKGVTLRDIEPLAIIEKDFRMQIIAWCRLRNDFRSFRLDRINTIKLKQEEFEPRPDFKIDDFQNNPNESVEQELEQEAS